MGGPARLRCQLVPPHQWRRVESVCACDRCWASIGFDPHTLVSSLEFRNSIASRLNSVKIKVLQLVAPDLKQQSCRRSAQKISNRKSQSMAQTATSKIKAPPAKNSVVAPTYAYKIIATLGHLCVTAFVLASFAAWYYYLSPKAKLATFCLFIYAHYRYVRRRAAPFSRSSPSIDLCGNQIQAPHAIDARLFLAASVRWRGDSTPSDVHTGTAARSPASRLTTPP